MTETETTRQAYLRGRIDGRWRVFNASLLMGVIVNVVWFFFTNWLVKEWGEIRFRQGQESVTQNRAAVYPIRQNGSDGADWYRDKERP